MKYQEQLQTLEWKKKREQILKQYNYRCANCHNKRFDDNLLAGVLFKKGFIGQPQSRNNNGKYYTPIINLRKEVIENDNAILPDELNPNISHLIYYEIKKPQSSTYNNYNGINWTFVYGIKPLNEDSIKKGNKVDVLKKGNRAYVTEDSFQEIYKPISSNDEWIYTPGVHIHHKYYQEDLMCWEYPSTALIAYCSYCHKDFHANNKVDHFDKDGNNIGELTACGKCASAGYLPEYEHVENGICFDCCGARFIDLIAYPLTCNPFIHF
jgi:hypothetical protein